MSSRHSRFQRPGRNRSRPYLEPLDDRSLPSVVFTTEDNGNDGMPTPGSLRAEIIESNSHAGPDVITFALSAQDPRHVYYRDDGVAGHVAIGNVTPTTTVDDTLITDIDPDWAHS